MLALRDNDVGVTVAVDIADLGETAGRLDLVQGKIGDLCGRGRFEASPEPGEGKSCDEERDGPSRSARPTVTPAISRATRWLSGGES
jgi:hypothetical protein